MQVLHYWLSHTPNYDEVTAWYLGWKSSFPPSLIDHERVRRQLNAALDMMNTVREKWKSAHLPSHCNHLLHQMQKRSRDEN